MAYGSQSYAHTTYGDGQSDAPAYSGPPIYSNVVTQNADYQIDENIGLALTAVTVADYQIDENIGWPLSPTPVADYQIDENFMASVSSSSNFLIRRSRR